jgi:Rrf2 family protein
MAKLFSLSEAATISIHAMILIGRSDIQLNVQQIAERTEASKHHLAKVLQRLTKAGFISSTRGPNGGFVLKKTAEEITMLDIYEAIEGKIDVSSCSLKHQICPKDKCIVNNLVNKVTVDFVNYFKNQTLKNYL